MTDIPKKSSGERERSQYSLCFVVVVFFISLVITLFSRGGGRTPLQGKGIGGTNHGWKRRAMLDSFLMIRSCLDGGGRRTLLSEALEPCQAITHHSFRCI